MDCAFCDIVAGDGDAHEVHRDDEVVAFLDIYPAVDGHTLVAPTAHEEGLFDLSDAAIGALFRTVRDVADAQQAALDAEGVSVVQSSGAAAGQDVMHVHAHVIPRFEGDSIHFAPSRSTLTDEEGAEVSAALAGEL